MEKEKRGRTSSGPVTRANGDQTKEKILDAAEELFGEKTFDTVSLRDITNHASVTLALASYHFGTKDNLFVAVVARRAHMLNRMRVERLAELDDAGVTDVGPYIDAFIRPLLTQALPDYRLSIATNAKRSRGSFPRVNHVRTSERFPLIWIAGVRDEQYRSWRPARPGRCNPTYPRVDLHFSKADNAPTR